MTSPVEKALTYADNLVKHSIRYSWWRPVRCGDSFFFTGGLPALKKVKENGVGCSGLINLMVQAAGFEIPPFPEGLRINKSYRGGTVFWERIFEERGVLEPFDYTKHYPIGTLFMRRYRNEYDQGHMAVMAKEEEKPLYSLIIHSFVTEEGIDGADPKGKVGYTSLGHSHFCGHSGKEGYYHFAIPPEGWLRN